MYTCKYCSTNLLNNRYCPFCDMIFSEEETCIDGQRPSVIIEEIPLDEMELRHSKTSDLKNEKTLYLYYLLKICRQSTRNYFASNNQEQYDFFMKKKFVLENILIERIGYIPGRLDYFVKKELKQYQEFEKKNQSNPMVIRTLLNPADLED